MVMERKFLISSVFIIVTTICCTPIWSRPYMYILLWVMLLPFIFGHLGMNVMHKYKSIVISAALFVFINIFYRVSGISDARWGRYLIYLFNFTLPVLMLIAPAKLSPKNIRRLWWVLVIIMQLMWARTFM